MNEEMTKHLEYLRTAPRDERGMTEGQAERHDIELEIIRGDFRPRALALAEDLGFDEKTALEYWRVIVEFRRLQIEEDRLRAYDHATAQANEYMARIERRLDELEGGDEDWKG
jgi:hypothetical protein